MSKMLKVIIHLPFILNLAHALTLPLYNATGAVFSLRQRPVIPGRVTFLAGGQVGSTQADPANPFGDDSFPDAIFVESLEIGTPPRKINLQMDTGSWQFWTYNTDCTAADTPIKFYDPSASTTSSEIENSSWSAGYGNSAFMTNLSSIFTDVVKFATVRLPNLAIGRPSESCNTAKGQVTQGLVGLGYGTWPNSHPPQNTFFTTLAPTLKLPLFAVSLNYRAPGFYDFGYIDNGKYSGPLSFFPVPSLPSPNLWGVNMTGYQIGSAPSFSKFDGGDLPAYIDSGGAFIFLPQKYVDAFYAQAPSVKLAKVDANHNGNAQATYLFPCEQTLPDLTIEVGAYNTTIPGQLLQGAKYNATTCISNLMASGPGVSPAALLGLPFLRTTFTVFKNEPGEGPTVGLARKPIHTSLVADAESPNPPDGNSGIINI